MAVNQPDEASGMFWAALPFSVAVGVHALSLFTGATQWWQYTTAVIVALLGITLMIVGVRSVVQHRHRRRADGVAPRGGRGPGAGGGD